MGVLDFIRDTGEKLTEMGEEAKLAGRIEKRIVAMGVSIKGLDVDVDGETAVLKGIAATEHDRDKAVQIAGNVWGISRVSDQLSSREEKMSAGKVSKAPRKKARTDSSGKKPKEPRSGGRKVRPSEPSRKNMKSSRSGKRRTP